MSITVTVHLNGVSVPVELDEQALAAIAAAVKAHAAQDAQVWPEWMSLPTASNYLDMPEERLRKLVARAAIPFTQEAPGCRIFFGRRDLDQWMRDDQTHERSRR